MNNKNPTISLIIPCYNEEKYLPRCLESVRKQTYKDFELIIVDNNCTDKTEAIGRSYGARVIKVKKQGIIPARQSGFARARGQIIVRTDADVILDSNWLSYALKVFLKNPQMIALSGVFSSPYKYVPDIFFKIYTLIFFSWIATLLTKHNFMIGPVMAVRKSIWEKTKVCTDDKLVHEDMDLACHLARFGYIAMDTKWSVPLSLRRVEDNLLKGLLRYLVEYPRRYIRTIFIHH